MGTSITPIEMLFENLITKRALSEKTSFSVSYIEKLMGKGLPYIKIGKSVRFKYTDVVTWLQERSTA